MELFGENFLRIRNEAIIPLISFGIKRDKAKHWSFKDVITKNLISLNKLSNGAYEIEISEADFYKALHCDIELFMNKSVVQYNDFITSKTSSPTWSFVTLYYLTFFSMTTLFRLMRKGFIFLQKEQTVRLEQFHLAMYSTPIVVGPGNYYFHFSKVNSSGNVILTLSNKGEGVHKLSWFQLENTIRDFIPYSDDDEKVVFNSLINFFSYFKTDFPSSLRNKLNYHGDSSFLDLEKKLSHIDLTMETNNLIKGIASIINDDSIENQVKSISYLSSFLLKYTNELYSEYHSRSAFGKDFVRSRNTYLKLNGLKSF